MFVPKNGAIIIGGNIDTKNAVALSKKYFGDWKNPKGGYFQNKALPKFSKSQSYNFSSKLTRIKTSDDTKGPKLEDQKDTYAADMLIGLLGQRTGKFYKKFMQSGETLDTGMYYHTQSHAGEINSILNLNQNLQKRLEKDPRKS